MNAHDELDWFGHYLLEGLYFDDVKEKKRDNFILNLLPYSWIFDDYYFYVTGQRRMPVKKPIQKTPRLMYEILWEFDSRYNFGYLKVACNLMDMSGASRDDLFKACEKLRAKTLRDREIHSITMPFIDGNFGFAYFFAPVEERKQFPMRVVNYSILKKYQTEFDHWVSITCIVDTPAWVDYFTVMEGSWEYSEDLERDSRKYLQPWTEESSE